MVLVTMAFLCGLTFDITWTYCIELISERRAVMAAHMSVLIYGLAIVSTIVIIEKSIPAICAYAVGSWIGTYIAVRGKK